MLPTEAVLVEEYDCSRNTVRRAISQLIDEGLVYSVKGRGVVILEKQNTDELLLNLSNFNGIQALNSNQKIDYQTKVIKFTKLTITDELHQLTSFPIGTEVSYIERVRIVNEKRMVLDINYFRTEIVSGLTEEIAKKSIYHYIEKDLGVKISTSRRHLKVEGATELDTLSLDLQEYNCVGIISNWAYTDMGKLFEYTESHFIPDTFAFVELSTKR